MYMTRKLLRALKFSLLSGMLLLRGVSDAQLPDTAQLPINYDYNYIENDTALSHLKLYFQESRDSVNRPLRILYIGDSHVKSGFYAETVAMLFDSIIRHYTANVIVHDSDSTVVKLKVMAKNGAMAKTILQSVYVDTVVQQFNPDLVVVSLGTNEAYNHVNMDTIAWYQESLIQQIFRDAPDCDLLLTTPGDGMKRHYQRVRISKKRRRYKTIVHYEVNDYLVDVVDYYVQIPERMDAAVWNFYPVMGGEESIRDWNRLGYAQGDMIHLTREGYRLQARLLVEALMESITGKSIVEE
jgi:lysophospholipase L1-like esterase